MNRTWIVVFSIAGGPAGRAAPSSVSTLIYPFHDAAILLEEASFFAHPSYA
jgi:hypothetical protein